MNDKQLQELEHCRLDCQNCSIKAMRGDKSCFSWVVEQLKEMQK